LSGRGPGQGSCKVLNALVVGWSALRSGFAEGVEDVGGAVAEGAVGGGDVGAAAEPDDIDGGVPQGP
jgi:hypothetical protein